MCAHSRHQHPPASSSPARGPCSAPGPFAACCFYAQHAKWLHFSYLCTPTDVALTLSVPVSVPHQPPPHGLPSHRPHAALLPPSPPPLALRQLAQPPKKKSLSLQSHGCSESTCASSGAAREDKALRPLTTKHGQRHQPLFHRPGPHHIKCAWPPQALGVMIQQMPLDNLLLKSTLLKGNPEDQKVPPFCKPGRIKHSTRASILLKQLVLSSGTRFHKFRSCQPYEEGAKGSEIFHAFLRSLLPWWLELQALLQVTALSPSHQKQRYLTCTPLLHSHAALSIHTRVTHPFQHHLCPRSRKTHGLLIAPKCIFCPPLLCLHHTASLWGLSVSHAALLHTQCLVLTSERGERKANRHGVIGRS